MSPGRVRLHRWRRTPSHPVQDVRGCRWAAGVAQGLGGARLPLGVERSRDPFDAPPIGLELVPDERPVQAPIRGQEILELACRHLERLQGRRLLQCATGDFLGRSNGDPPLPRSSVKECVVHLAGHVAIMSRERDRSRSSTAAARTVTCRLGVRALNCRRWCAMRRIRSEGARRPHMPRSAGGHAHGWMSSALTVATRHNASRTVGIAVSGRRPRTHRPGNRVRRAAWGEGRRDPRSGPRPLLDVLVTEDRHRPGGPPRGRGRVRMRASAVS